MSLDGHKVPFAGKHDGHTMTINSGSFIINAGGTCSRNCVVRHRQCREGSGSTFLLSDNSSNRVAQNRLARKVVLHEARGMTLKMKHLAGVESGGAVSSVVEHFLDTEGVRGSNPLSRTI